MHNSRFLQIAENCFKELFGDLVRLGDGGDQRDFARLEQTFREGWASGGAAVMDVSAGNGETRIASLPFEGARLPASGMAVELPFEAETDLAGVEVRLFCRPGFTGALETVEIAPVPADRPAAQPGA